MDEFTEPEYDKSALVIIDMQKDFSLKGSISEVKGTSDVVPKIAELAKGFRSANKPIIHIVRLYKADGSNVDACRRKTISGGKPIAISGSEGSQIVTDLLPNVSLDSRNLLDGNIQEISDNEFIIYKSRWGAFYKTPLEDFLKSKGITTLVFAGCNFPNCPRTTIFEASERDFRLVVATDAISGIYEKGIQELQNISCQVILTNDILEKL
jgi:nicotinamidase-related amidase